MDLSFFLSDLVQVIILAEFSYKCANGENQAFNTIIIAVRYFLLIKIMHITFQIITT